MVLPPGRAGGGHSKRRGEDAPPRGPLRFFGGGEWVGRLTIGVLRGCLPCAILSKLKTTRDGRSVVAQTTMTVRVGGALAEFVASNVGENGRYENVSEYIRDLIRRDKERVEQEAFERLKAELQHAFAAADDSFEPLTAADVIARNRR